MRRPQKNSPLRGIGYFLEKENGELVPAVWGI
jgi:hypothetical protein